jgi:murein DD-endopeptidase MepM/ murein hydrolase activator NlpD
MSSPTARHAAPRAPRSTSRRTPRRAGVVVGVLAGGVLLSTALAPSANAEADADTTVQWERTTEPTPDPEPTPLLPESPALVEGPVGTDAAAPDVPAATTAPAPTRAPRARAARSAPRPQVVRPVSTYRISATFGDSGSRWSSGRHTGLDFAAPYGTPVRAVAAGRVVEAGWDGSYGNAVVIEHAGGVRTRYAHLASDSVRVGEQVAAGEKIGAVGSTGNSSGNHLHLEVITAGGGFTDPRDWLRDKGVRV